MTSKLLANIFRTDSQHFLRNLHIAYIQVNKLCKNNFVAILKKALFQSNEKFLGVSFAFRIKGVVPLATDILLLRGLTTAATWFSFT